MADNCDRIVDQVLERVGRRLVIGLPLGLGKPNRLVNAFYARALDDPGIDLEIVTALSLDIPQPGHWLEARLMEPIVERLFGSDYPRLAWLDDQRAGKLPGNIRITEFYFSSGSALGNDLAQRRYISSNYTHVARDLIDRGVNVLLQLVAAGEIDGQPRLSLACNPDVTLDLMRRLDDAPDHDCLIIGQLHPELPFMHGDAVLDRDRFGVLIEDDPGQPLFGIPRTPVSPQDHWVGLHASTLIADGGTLQIGIGSLSDALVHALIRRHREPARHAELLAEAGVGPDDPVVRDLGGMDVFDKGLFGASEMFMDGFMHLYRAGILRREVFDDQGLQELANTGDLENRQPDRIGTGAVMEGGFFLGSAEFYAWLAGLDESERPRFRMHGVGRINQLYGGNESLEILQRRKARFVNTCMMMTATGAAVSDGLADYRVVSGVGGQYNFVAMAHAMDDGRSILLLRSTRESGGRVSSNVIWDYPHVTIPRHLRDLVVTEYGVADLRGKSDEECIQAMIGITDARFQDELAERARAAGKLDPDWSIPDDVRGNTPERLRARSPGPEFPEYPFGCDFTDLEQQLIPALRALKAASASRWTMLKLILKGRPYRQAEYLARLGLDRPAGLRERLTARALAAVLDRSND